MGAAHSSSARLASVVAVLLLLSIVPIAHSDYGRTLFWPLTRMVALVLFLACCLAYRHAGMQLRDFGSATLWLSALTAALAFTGARAAVSDGVFAATGGALFLAIGRLACLRFGVAAAVLGNMCALLIGLAVLTFALPCASYLPAWPLLSAILAYGAGLLPDIGPRQRIAIGLAGVIPAAALAMPFLAQLDGLPPPMRGALLGLGIATLLGCVGGPLRGLEMRAATRAGLPCDG